MLRLDPMLTTFYRYWEAQRGSKAMPSRADIDPSDIPALLPHIQLVDIIEGGRRFRFRLVGTAIVTAYGGELTGRYFDEVMSTQRLAVAERHYRAACDARRPVYIRAAYATSRNGDVVANRIVAPLSADSFGVNMTMTLQTFDYGVPVHAAIDCGADVGADGSIVIPLPVGADLTEHVMLGTRRAA